jgi:hypothetical protein
LKQYPTAGEAVLWHEPTPSGLHPENRAILRARTPEELERDSAQRAKVRVRRWIRANKCAFMWTFTFRRAPTSYSEVGQAVDRFFRRLVSRASDSWGRNATPPPFLIAPERGPKTGRWHCHGVTDRYVAHRVIEECWAEGFVFVSPAPNGAKHWAPRKLAAYISKYITKDTGELLDDNSFGRPKGAHRYWVTQGRQPEEQDDYFVLLAPALSHLRRTYGDWDAAYVFGLDGEHPLIGVRLDFPDSCIERYEERVKADSRAQRGQP